MKNVLVDKNNNIVYEGNDAKEILRVINADIYSVSEDDELKYLDKVRTLIDVEGNPKYEELKHEVHMDIKFIGIDDCNRPVFKDIDSSIYIGDVNKLWTYNELGENNHTINTYYKQHIEELEFFGTSFNCEPHECIRGLPLNYKLNIIDNENKF